MDHRRRAHLADLRQLSSVYEHLQFSNRRCRHTFDWRSQTNTTLSGNITVDRLFINRDVANLELTSTDNSFRDLRVFAGRLRASSIGNFGETSAAGTGGANTPIILGSSGGSGIFEYTGNSVSVDRTFTRDARSTASGISVATAGETLTISTALSSGSNTNLTTSGWAFGGAGNLTLDGVINDATGAGSTGTTVTKSGTGTLTLGGANTYTGDTTVTEGTLQIGNGSTTGSFSNTTSITLAGGSLAFNRSDSITQGVNFLTNGSTLTGAGGFIQMGSGTTILTAANTYTGGTVVSGGALLFSNGAAIQNSVLDMAGGSLLFDGALTAATVGGLNGTGGLVLTNNNGDAVTLTLANAAATVLSDTTTISGTGGLVLSGAGTQTLLGANTFSGGFVLSDGAKVRVGTGTASVSDGAVTASSLGAGAITINGGTIFGNSGTVGSTNLTINSDFAINEGVTGGLNARLRLFGAFDMAGGERTVSLGNYTNSAASVLLSGRESLRFETAAAGGPAVTSFTNGTLRLVRDASGGTDDYVGVRFDFNTGIFYDGAGLTVGSNVITVLSSGFVFHSFGARPQVEVEAGGYFNLSDNINARVGLVQTLSGAGTVTSLASSDATSMLTILPNSGDNGYSRGRSSTARH